MSRPTNERIYFKKMALSSEQFVLNMWKCFRQLNVDQNQYPTFNNAITYLWRITVNISFILIKYLFYYIVELLERLVKTLVVVFRIVCHRQPLDIAVGGEVQVYAVLLLFCYGKNYLF